MKSSRTAHFAPLFRRVFIAAAMVAVMLVEERPLRGPATRVTVEPSKSA
jgi:hypothetical protein